ncbi:MAG: hypothetical protein K6G90_13535 [Clostridia bacterium]|nr:hypothetical protein [Clostridia bacterium]
MLENAVAVALHRRYGEEIYCLRSSETGIDVDFWIPETKTAIQVCRSLNDGSYDREIRSIKKLVSAGNTARSIVVTKEEAGTIDENGIRIEVIPAYRFLLEN